MHVAIRNSLRSNKEKNYAPLEGVHHFLQHRHEPLVLLHHPHKPEGVEVFFGLLGRHLKRVVGQHLITGGVQRTSAKGKDPKENRGRRKEPVKPPTVLLSVMLKHHVNAMLSCDGTHDVMLRCCIHRRCTKGVSEEQRSQRESGNAEGAAKTAGRHCGNAENPPCDVMLSAGGGCRGVAHITQHPTKSHGGRPLGLQRARTVGVGLAIQTATLRDCIKHKRISLPHRHCCASPPSKVSNHSGHPGMIPRPNNHDSPQPPKSFTHRQTLLAAGWKFQCGGMWSTECGR